MPLISKGNQGSKLTFAYGSTLTGRAATGTDAFRLDGITKLFNRPTTDAMAAEVKTEFTGTNSGHFALQVTADWKGNGVAGGGNGAVQGVARVASTFTMSGGSVVGNYGQVAVNGIVDGSGIMLAGQYGLIEDGGTYTAVSHVCAGWFDSHLTKTVTAGHSELLYLTNNGVTGSDQTQLESVFYVHPGNRITNLLTLSSGFAAGMLSENTAAKTTLDFANWRTIKVNIEGETHYIPVAKAITATGA